MNRKQIIALAKEASIWKDANGRHLDSIDELERFAALIQANTVPPGYKVVPIEPTVEMMNAVYMTDWARTAYKAMLNAAPTI